MRVILVLLFMISIVCFLVSLVQITTGAAAYSGWTHAIAAVSHAEKEHEPALSHTQQDALLEVFRRQTNGLLKIIMFFSAATCGLTGYDLLVCYRKEKRKNAS